jgi:type I restriction enzyme, S subunit
VKAGMMQDLFTRGLTAQGKLRPTRQQAPNQYQNTPIGWIPKEWDCECLEKLLANIPNNIRSGPFGSALLKSQLAEEGIAFLGIDNIHVERFDRGFRRFVDQKTFARLSRYAARAGDVIITIMGTVGRCAVFPDDVGQALSSKHLWTMTFDQDRYLPDLICWQLNYAPWVKAWFRRETQGGIMDAIQSKTLRNLRLPVPKLHEQLEIYKRYTTVSTKLDNEQEVLEKLRQQKSGLMQDLLTGKVAVKV